MRQLNLFFKFFLVLGFSSISLISCSRNGDSAYPASLPNTPLTINQPSTTPIPQLTLTPNSVVVEKADPTSTNLDLLITASPTPTINPLSCLQESGRMELSSFRSKRLPLPMEYRVWLPPCYDAEPQMRFPMLYLVHGMNYNEDQWDRLGVDEVAQSLIASKEVTPFIIVLPRDRNWGQPEEDPFGDVFVEELLPYIDQQYRTIPERDFRAIGGLSRGAGWAVHLGLKRWDLFGILGGHSLPVFWTDTQRIHRWLSEIPAGKMPRIYLDIGDHDRPQILESAMWFEELLNEKGISHEWHLFSGYHEEAYWQRHVEQYLRWYSSTWWNRCGGFSDQWRPCF